MKKKFDLGYGDDEAFPKAMEQCAEPREDTATRLHQAPGSPPEMQSTPTLKLVRTHVDLPWQRAGRSSSASVAAPLPCQLGPYRAWISGAYARDRPLVHWLAQLERGSLRDGKLLAQGRHRVLCVDYRDHVFAVKSFGRQPFLKDWVDFRRGSKARRSFGAAVHLQAHGVGTPAPVACLERWSGRRLVESHFITLYAPNLSEFRQELVNLYRNEPDCEKLMSLLQTVACAIARLHGSGFMHGDLGNQNILVRRHGPSAWNNVMFVDLNRARTGPVESLRRRAFDISRISLPSDLLRIFIAMYFGDTPVPLAFRRWEKFYRRLFAFHTITRPWRHPLRALGERRVTPDPAVTYPPFKDLWLWDERSAQAIGTLRGKERKYLYPRINLLKIAASVATASMPIHSLYDRHVKNSFSSPVDMSGRAGMTVHPRPESWHTERAWLERLGPCPLMVRFYHHEGPENWDYTIKRVQELDRAGYSVSIAMVQDRQAVKNPGRWAGFVDQVLGSLGTVVEWVQVGHAINRVKWGLWTLDEYAQLCEPFVSHAGSHGGFRLMGPAVIDFEYQYVVAALQRVQGLLHFHALSHLLYVDRRGAPENKQLGFTTVEKCALARAIAHWAPSCESRLIISEVNWPLLGTGVHSPVGSPYEEPGPRHNDPSVTEADYASYMIRYLALAIASGHVERVYWWRLAAHGFGLIDDRGTEGWRARPAFDALRFFLGLMEKSVFERPLTTPSGAVGLLFRRPDGERIVMAYAHPSPMLYHPPYPFDGICNVFGQERAARKKGMPIPLTGQPIYIRGVQLPLTTTACH